MKCEICKNQEAVAYLYPAYKTIDRTVPVVVKDADGKKRVVQEIVREIVPVDLKRMTDHLESRRLRKNICGDCVPGKFKRIATFAFQEV